MAGEPAAQGPWCKRSLTALGVAIAAALLSVGLVASRLLLVPGLHDNDWPLLMWLAKEGSLADPEPWAVGHYGIAQLLLVRAVWPVFGGTVAAAKVLNATCVGASAWLVWKVARQAGGTTAGALAFLAFATSGPALLTGQSEFADPPALALLLAGLMLARSGRGGFRWLAAGWFLGAAGTFRIHFQIFGVVFGALLALDRVSRRGQGARKRMLDVSALGAGFLVGVAPMAILF